MVSGVWKLDELDPERSRIASKEVEDVVAVAVEFAGE